MANLKVEVQDGNNLTVEVTPVANQIITIDRNASGSVVSSVTAAAPITSTGGLTPQIGITQATTSSDGYLSSTDWNTFNNKQAAGSYLTSVTADAPLSGSGTSASHLSIPPATTSANGYLTSTDWTTFNNKVGSITSTDNSVTVTGTTTRDLSVASSPNVICLVRNNTGATLTKGTAVYINGAIGQNPTVAKALATSDATSAQTLGLINADLANNSNGYVTLIGLISDMNTSAYTDGAQLYLSYTTAGALTATKPKAPNHLVYVAIVEHAHPTQGKLFVKVQNGYELDELHDVQITSPVNGQTIIYDATTSLWKNANLTAGSGVSITNGAGSVTVAANFASPPAIGSTTPNAITGTTITAKTSAIIGDGTNPSGIYGNLSVEDWSGIGGDYYLTLKSTDGTYNYPIVISDGAYVFNGFSVYNNFTSYGTSWLQSDVTVGVAGTSTALIQLYAIGGNAIILTVPTTLSTNYTLTLPPTAGSANQVLKTDGTGVTDWTSAITLNGISDPSAPTGTNTTVYSKSFGGYPTLAGRNALNTSFGLQSALWSKNIQMWTTTAATAGSWLNASGTGNGTYTNVNPTAGSTLYQTVRRSTYANVITTTNQTLGILNGQNSFFRGSVAGQGGYFFYARCGFDVWTNGGRFFAGMSQSTTVVTANATGTNNTAGFAVEDTDAGAISFVTRSGTASTKTAVGLTITSNKGYDCYIYCSPNDNKISWQIIDINTGTSVTGTANTNLPTNTFMANPMVLASNAALTPATSISLGVARIYIESDY